MDAQNTLWPVCLLLLVACGPEPDDESAAEQAGQAPAADAQKETEMVAYVNDTGISRALLAHEAQRVTGRALSELDADTVDKLLDSVVMRRALALQAAESLDAGAEQRLNAEVEAFREQLLVKRHLSDNASVQSVTTDKVTAYYEEHKDRYRLIENRRYEILAVKPEGADRQAILETLQNAKDEQDWRPMKGKIKALGASVTLTRGEVKPEILEAPLKKLLDSLIATGESRLSQIGDTTYLARIAAPGRVTYQPLEKVSASIRRALSATEVKRAIRALGDRVLEEADVERVELSPAGQDAG